MEEVWDANTGKQGKTCINHLRVRIIFRQRKHESGDILKVVKEQRADRNVQAYRLRAILAAKLLANYAICLKPILFRHQIFLNHPIIPFPILLEEKVPRGRPVLGHRSVDRKQPEQVHLRASFST